MDQHSTSVEHASGGELRVVIYAIIFTLFLVPVSVHSLSVNYSFLSLPLLQTLITRKARRPPTLCLQIMGLFLMIFIVAATYQYQFYGEAMRRIASFVLFMGMFAYMFVKIDEQMVAAFKLSLVSISVILSLSSLYVFFVSGGSAALGFEAKDLVGSQRIGFIYLLALWVTYLYRTSNALHAMLRYSTLVVVLVGLLLTFSRSSIVGLFASFGLFALVNVFKWLRRPTLKGLAMSVAALAGIGLLAFLLYLLVPLTFDFFQERILSIAASSDAVSANVEDPLSTGGIRLYVWGEIIKFVTYNPLTGSGFLGVWVLLRGFTGVAGSAHNQFADVLLRTGVLGFLAYACLLFLVARHLYKSERSLFWGFVAVLCYGIFHETFKESQGGFVLAFLLGMMSQHRPRAASNASELSSRLGNPQAGEVRV